MKWNEIAYIRDSPLSKKILECLTASDRPLTPLEISKKTDIASSTKLGLLRKRKLVICINPETKKSRFYKVTPSGKRILSELKKIG